jgi:CRP-like cAMP-binding protein
VPPVRSRNLLLNALSAKDYDSIRPFLELVTLEAKRVLHNPGEPSSYVYFPRGGFLSMAIVLENGAMVEVAAIGREGMAGLTAKGPGRGVMTNTLVVVQGHDECAYRMRSEDFHREMDRCSAFMELINHYGEAFLGVMMQSAGCNAAHNIEQRLAKWLLMAHDRMEVEEFSITQEFVAMMLGATRQTVTGVAGSLQKAGLIRYQRGRVRILDREGLQDASCECYRISTALLRSVLPSRPRPRSRPK